MAATAATALFICHGCFGIQHALYLSPSLTHTRTHAHTHTLFLFFLPLACSPTIKTAATFASTNRTDDDDDDDNVDKRQ
jgi:hypothetical protein